jgi:hypothetical protein
MSSEAQKPKIINREELKTEAKWLKMEKINWKDQDGKEVALLSLKVVLSWWAESVGMC